MPVGFSKRNSENAKEQVEIAVDNGRTWKLGALKWLLWLSFASYDKWPPIFLTLEALTNHLSSKGFLSEK